MKLFKWLLPSLLWLNCLSQFTHAKEGKDEFYVLVSAGDSSQHKKYAPVDFELYYQREHLGGVLSTMTKLDPVIAPVKEFDDFDKREWAVFAVPIGKVQMAMSVKGVGGKTSEWLEFHERTLVTFDAASKRDWDDRHEPIGLDKLMHIQGRVDPKLTDGKSVAVVALFNDWPTARAKCDQRGDYSLELPHDENRPWIQLAIENGKSARYTNTIIRYVQNEKLTDVNLSEWQSPDTLPQIPSSQHLLEKNQPPLVWIGGTIRDAEKRPIGGARVFALGRLSGALRRFNQAEEATTDSGGHYQLPNPLYSTGYGGPDRMKLMVYAEGQSPLCVDSTLDRKLEIIGADAVVSEFEHRTRQLGGGRQPYWKPYSQVVDLELSQKPVKLTIQASLNGRPATEKRIVAVSRDVLELRTVHGFNSDAVDALLNPSAITNERGEAVFKLLRQGEYDCKAMLPSECPDPVYWFSQPDLIHHFQVESGENRKIEIKD